MGDGEDDSGSGEESDNIYKRSVESVLVSLSNLYSNDEISVSNSRYSFCPAYTVTNYFTLLTTNLYLNFGLRKPFYSKQHLKAYCYFSA